MPQRKCSYPILLITINFKTFKLVLFLSFLFIFIFLVVPLFHFFFPPFIHSFFSFRKGFAETSIESRNQKSQHLFIHPKFHRKTALLLAEVYINFEQIISKMTKKKFSIRSYFLIFSLFFFSSSLFLLFH